VAETVGATVTENDLVSIFIFGIGIQVTGNNVGAIAMLFEVEGNVVNGNAFRGVDIEGPDLLLAFAALGLEPGTLDLESNWWGDASGPGVDGAGPGTGHAILNISSSATLDFDPWLCSGVDLQPAKPGFQTVESPDTFPCEGDTTPPVIEARAVKHTSGGDVPYAFGTWSKDQVTLEFVCTDPGDDASGVAEENLPSRNFSNDGIYDVEDFIGPEHFCVDNAGNPAELPDLDGLQILVDRHAPTCSVSPLTQSVPKAPAEFFTRSVSFSSQDGALSGNETVILKSVKTNGFGAFQNWNVGTPDTQGKFAGAIGAIYTVTYQVSDPAGHKSTCSAQVKTAR